MENNDTGTDLPEGWRLQSNSWMIAKIETLHDIGSETNERMKYWRDRYLKLNAKVIMETHAGTFEKLSEGPAPFPEVEFDEKFGAARNEYECAVWAFERGQLPYQRLQKDFTALLARAADLEAKLNDHKEMSRQHANHNANLRDKIEALEKEVERLKEYEWMYKDLEK